MKFGPSFENMQSKRNEFQKNVQNENPERAIIARLTTIGDEGSLGETVDSLKSVIEEVNGEQGLEEDVVSRLREMVAKKRSELFDRYLSQESEGSEKEKYANNFSSIYEMRGLHDLATLDVGLGDSDVSDREAWTQILEPKAVKIYTDWAAGAEYVNNITNVKESVDRFPFTDEARRTELYSK
ncbi:MAG: hypothetical protein HGA61_03540, partial [Candidatus Moranbacteria bacterium]|nr:hypothetical protein [Candidatus Moranbacteria bacterium]